MQKEDRRLGESKTTKMQNLRFPLINRKELGS